MAAKDVKFSRDAALKAGAREFHRFLFKAYVVPCDFQSLLAASQFDIVPCHLGQQTHHRIVASLDRALPFRRGSFERAALAAEQVDFPRSVEAGLINVVLERKVRRQRQGPEERLVLALEFSGIGTGGIERRPKIGRTALSNRPRLLQPCLSHTQIQIRSRRALDERVKLGIVERSPPGRGCGRAPNQSVPDGRAPRGGSMRRGGVIIRADDAAACSRNAGQRQPSDDFCPRHPRNTLLLVPRGRI